VIDHTKLSQTQRLELETLGRLRTAPDEEYSNVQGFMLEDWLIDADTPQELRLRRPAGVLGKRYVHGQLVAARPADGRTFVLCQVRSLICAPDGELRIGIKPMPGAPGGLSLRPLGLNEKDRSVHALSLGAVPALKEPPSLVLPTGSFKPERAFQLQGDAPKNVKLTALLERGADFERVTYQAD
jgi:hypothetical protein